MSQRAKGEYIVWDEDVEVSWIEVLAEFDDKVWPVFERRGYTKDTALLLWSIIQLKKVVNDIASAVVEYEDEEEETGEAGPS